MSFTPQHSRKYFEARLQGQRLASGPEVKVKCPFHEDEDPSLSVNLERGVWRCHAGCGDGGLLDFEMKLTSCDRDTARSNVAEVIGDRQMSIPRQQPETIYSYHDAQGRVVFEKLRYAGKKFVQRKPNGKGGYEYKLGEVRKPLYRLPEVLVSNEVLICEGEKDCDTVHALELNNRDAGVFVTATTNFAGAGKWNDADSVLFASKRVVILPDNDEPGRKHAEQVARSVYPYALGVKVVRLPGLPDKGDVSDWLKTHSREELIEEIKQAPAWHPAEQGNRLALPLPEFVLDRPSEVDWMVEGVIQRGANGFFCAAPKGGKSWAAVDLALSLALGCDWLGFQVPRPVKVVLISREDNPALTAWRIRHLLAPKRPADPSLIATNMYVNSRAQSPELMLDNPEQMLELVDALRRIQPEFVIFDVFNVLHAADENDNTEIRGVLKRLSQLQAEIGCGIGMIHHFNKAETGSMTQRLRGSSAIAGWAEWLIGISLVDEEQKIRRMDFELKAAQPPDAVHFRIDSDSRAGWAKLERTEYVRPTASREGTRAERYMRQ